MLYSLLLLLICIDRKTSWGLKGKAQGTESLSAYFKNYIDNTQCFLSDFGHVFPFSAQSHMDKARPLVQNCDVLNPLCLINKCLH